MDYGLGLLTFGIVFGLVALGLMHDKISELRRRVRTLESEREDPRYLPVWGVPPSPKPKPGGGSHD